MSQEIFEIVSHWMCSKDPTGMHLTPIPVMKSEAPILSIKEDCDSKNHDYWKLWLKLDGKRPYRVVPATSRRMEEFDGIDLLIMDL